ncbi:SRPBCC family protein [Hoyosella sp. YIM 151337]|uniref:SRPBCC family protein n=1 Tax=Hoyosella sp. YIM 151337 TaxID=2992742 RepID=UPI002235DE68|nr:SRPBCC family protein [Hoyosella sp. YIM 151337]MCW4352673.1 SRPBCC family protein [Hoyosella sp. YIM 151337]
MGQVSATNSITIAAPVDTVFAALADYENVRPRILSAHYRDYRVVEGGNGDGTIAQWTLQATSKRSRDIKAAVSIDGTTIVERDANSSLVTTWSIAPAGAGSEVTTTTQWKGAGGIGGFFEKTFAPLGLKKIQAEVLENLKADVEK